MCREWLPKGEEVNRLTTTGRGLDEVSQGHWQAKGELFDKLKSRLDALGSHGCRAILWHQGESDAGQSRGGAPADRQISGDDYSRYMKTLVEASRQAAGWQVPWFTAQATYHSESDPADDEFPRHRNRCGIQNSLCQAPIPTPWALNSATACISTAADCKCMANFGPKKSCAWLDTQLPSN